MKVFYIPYRWTFRTFNKNVWWIFYSLRRGINNIIRWTPLIWEDEDFDWEFLADVMEWKMRKMSRYFKEYGHGVGSDRRSRELLICAELLRRLIKDDDRDLEKSIMNRKISTRHMARMKEWQEMLGEKIGRKLYTWWD